MLTILVELIGFSMLIMGNLINNNIVKFKALEDDSEKETLIDQSEDELE